MVSGAYRSEFSQEDEIARVMERVEGGDVCVWAFVVWLTVYLLKILP